MKRKGLIILLVFILLVFSILGVKTESVKEGLKKKGSGDSCTYDTDCNSNTCLKDIVGKLRCALEPVKI
tara:strand:- start:31 stop:237 length:207 start_codon:yes stop_codon:yes gene_type:complete